MRWRVLTQGNGNTHGQCSAVVGRWAGNEGSVSCSRVHSCAVEIRKKCENLHANSEVPKKETITVFPFIKEKLFILWFFLLLVLLFFLIVCSILKKKKTKPKHLHWIFLLKFSTSFCLSQSLLLHRSSCLCHFFDPSFPLGGDSGGGQEGRSDRSLGCQKKNYQ